MRTIAEKLLPMRFTIPLLIILVMFYSLISEINYRNTKETLTRGIALTDARIGAARLLHLLTDAEAAQRGFLLTGDANYIEPLRHAQAEFEQSSQFLQFIASIGQSGAADAVHIHTLVSEKFAELDRTIKLAESGKRDQALMLVRTDAGRQPMDELRNLFKNKLAEAAQLQQGARESIYSALRFSRFAEQLLSIMLVVGLLLFLRKLGARERERAGNQKKLEFEVNEKTQGLRTMASWLETAREDEKANLARELHDELGSLLTSAKLTLARMRPKLAHDAELVQRMDSVNQRLNEGIALKRRIIEDLRPSTLTLLGLHVAMANLCADASSQMGIRVSSEIAPVQAPPEAELALYRVLQEALTNIGKYSGATDVLVGLRLAGEALHLEVADNGKGFDVSTLQPSRHGLAGMRFRVESQGGNFSVVSAPGQGTRVAATLPLTSDRSRDAPNSVSGDSVLQPF